MRYLADLAVALLDLVEAEGRLLRARVVSTGVMLALIGVAGALILVGAAALLAALYLAAAPGLGKAGSALLVGILSLLLGGMLLWLTLASAHRRGR